MLLILCVTRADPRVWPMLRRHPELAARTIWLADGQAAFERLQADAPSGIAIGAVNVNLGIHRTMQVLVDTSEADYVLFLDDDETVTPDLGVWIRDEGYRTHPCWLLSRAWLWGPDGRRLDTPWHWPDLQLRVAERTHTLIPTRVHGGWIQRFGIKPKIAPGSLEHHKLLLKNGSEIQADMEAYEQRQPGAGFAQQYCPPEDAPTLPWPA